MKKKLTGMLVALLLGAIFQPLLAQDDAISRYFSQYAEDERFTTVNVSSKMFGLFSHLDAEKAEDKEVLETISKLKGLKVLVTDSIGDGWSLYRAAVKRPSKEYEELMSVKKSEEEMVFYIRENNGAVKELLMLLGGDHKFFVMSLVGNIDLKGISKLANNVKIDGLNYLENIN